ncbi:MAG: hypothetical protein ACJ8LG_10865 [Massilia sp.]
MPNLLIIGCGAAIHPVHLHGWNETFVDVNPAANPTHQWSITDAAHVGLLKTQYAAHFHCIFFENIPNTIFTSDLVTLVVMNALDQILRPGGVVRFRTGADGGGLAMQIKKTFLRWGYQVIHEAARDLAAAVHEHDLAVPDNELDEPFDLQFQKVPGATRTAATV